jgi:hypothetical protein
MKLTLRILALTLLISTTCFQASAIMPTEGKKPAARAADMTDEQKQVRLAQIQQRAEEIRNIDRSVLSRSERKELRKEARELRREVRNMRGGVYLSVGAIIIIILLLILLL